MHDIFPYPYKNQHVKYAQDYEVQKQHIENPDDIPRKIEYTRKYKEDSDKISSRVSVGYVFVHSQQHRYCTLDSQLQRYVVIVYPQVTILPGSISLLSITGCIDLISGTFVPSYYIVCTIVGETIVYPNQYMPKALTRAKWLLQQLKS